MTAILIIAVFIAGYTVIVLENPLRINKAASALLTGVLCWLVLALSNPENTKETLNHLNKNLADISQILFFLIGAMTIVELIDSHGGFNTISGLIRTNNKQKLLWVICFITFFLSAVLDNLTTAIVIVSLLRKLIHEENDRLVFASMVIIAANAGGAWSPIGDVTTTMLWIGGQVTAVNIIKELFIPSIFALVIPLAYQSLFIKGEFSGFESIESNLKPPEPGAGLIFFLGLGALVFVPVFKTVTNLPPYTGMLFCLGIMWMVTDLMHHKYEQREHLRVGHALTRIDISSVLFFLGILLAIGAVEAAGLLKILAQWLDQAIGNSDLIVMLIGLASAVIDNVPLVAASIGMYDLSTYPVDSKLWEMLAYCTGTGGSILIIGSAAGVIVMGMEKIDFIWYLKKISFPALLGYFAGAIAYLVFY